MGLIKRLGVVLILWVSMMTGLVVFTPQQAYAAPCSSSMFFGLPTWYKYLEGEDSLDPLTGATTCNVQMEGLSDIWLVVAAVIEILLRIAALVAIGFVLFGGVSYILSQGAPDKTKQALMTIINALIGLAIAVVAAALVSFIANRFN